MNLGNSVLSWIEKTVFGSTSDLFLVFTFFSE